MTNDKINKILERAKKLLALAGNNPSQEEAEAAMMQAQKLLLKHGLKISDAEDHGEPVKAQHHNANSGTKTVPWWHQRIAGVVAKNFRCDHYKSTSRGWSRRYTTSRMVFVGLPGDVDLAVEIFKLAVETAKREATKFLVRQKKKEAEDGYAWQWNRSRSIAIRNDYLQGWVDGLRLAFVKNVEENALVVVKPPEVREAMNAMNLRFTRGSQLTSAYSGAARSAGKADGARFNNRKKLT